MDEDDDSGNLKTVAQQIFGKAAETISSSDPPKPETNDAIDADVSPLAVSPVGERLPQATGGPESIKSAAQQKYIKTASELAEMIERDLASHPDCPRTGFQVTVYGWPHWRAMLTIKPAAGPIRNPQTWRDLTDQLAERLRARYDVA
jgi:hypothetical protein